MLDLTWLLLILTFALSNLAAVHAACRRVVSCCAKIHLFTSGFLSRQISISRSHDMISSHMTYITCMHARAAADSMHTTPTTMEKQNSGAEDRVRFWPGIWPKQMIWKGQPKTSGVSDSGSTAPRKPTPFKESAATINCRVAQVRRRNEQYGAADKLEEKAK